MGCFDYVTYTCKCPNCNADVSGFQTKDCECIFATKEISDVLNFYSSCSNCNEWIEFNRIRGFKVSENMISTVQTFFKTLSESMNNIGDVETLKNNINQQLQDKN